MLGSLAGWESIGLFYLPPHPPHQSLGGSESLRSHPWLGSYYRAKESGEPLQAGFLRETRGVGPGCALPVRLGSQTILGSPLLLLVEPDSFPLPAHGHPPGL